MIHIVKRRRHKEDFDERKIYASVYSACLSSHLSKEEAEKIAGEISEKVKNWVSTEKEVTSNQIFIKVGEELEKINKPAGFMYSTHRDIS
ncbi:hypothetical protein HYS91_04815 [Candidatus Daviesbacteria bacterium]|nr:hypothetical protein [Candidatus Daviesbacteria bacterium]